MRYVVRPISDRTVFSGKHRPSQFGSSLRNTQTLLFSEVGHLKGRDLVLEVDVAERHIRNDGMLRADARPVSPAVRIAFESAHGPLTYGTDTFSTWQDNLRAIALALEALRKVDRYGITKRGEQYAGFKALPAGREMPASHMTRERAVAILACYVNVPPEHLNLEHDSLRSTWRSARRHAHPDRHAGDQTKWDQVEQAAVVLGVDR
ncbi:hypothetical protein NPS01_25190 [Nocardioides psychrotolerans]|uniref:DnaJ domain-containing protein n=1 Tax=Nocardioides psychrotolerans TaxID=1005945 RepID=A0A1I3LLP3_9ACTN|nr:hypothetical protein [Nocardioides psychrotolerans]GEP38856.1 hypothetical protein NPS01_25190 [Nocardioides psychrotolerans]SFI85627.1 hypothetical protein SAMN05216561_11421 [Nocardioides psychrotolerans]